MKLLALSLAGVLAITSISQLMQEQHNTLSEKEKKEGWQLLFDGNTTNNWRPFQNKASDGWEVVNGELHCKETSVKNRADLITVQQYSDFELSFDWKVARGANSGAMYRVTENHDGTYETGPEYQLIDDNGYAEPLAEWQKSGADYAMHAPSKIMAKAAGDYNHSRIIVRDDAVEHWLNGEKVVDFRLWSNEWYQRKAISKWKDAADYGMNKKGHIAIQDHGGGIWFRNIKIKPL